MLNTRVLSILPILLASEAAMPNASNPIFHQSIGSNTAPLWLNSECRELLENNDSQSTIGFKLEQASQLFEKKWYEFETYLEVEELPSDFIVKIGEAVSAARDNFEASVGKLNTFLAEDSSKTECKDSNELVQFVFKNQNLSLEEFCKKYRDFLAVHFFKNRDEILKKLQSSYAFEIFEIRLVMTYLEALQLCEEKKITEISKIIRHFNQITLKVMAGWPTVIEIISLGERFKLASFQ